MPPPPFRILAAGAAIAIVMSAPEAQAFTLFGVTLWGSRTNAAGEEIIDPLSYAVEVRILGDEDLEGTVAGGSTLVADQGTPASGRGGLLSKARGDYRRIIGALYNAGYYGPYVSITLAGQEAADMTLATPLPPRDVPVVITVDPGPQFVFGKAELRNGLTFPRARRQEELSPAERGFAPGEQARAPVIGQASALSVERWRDLSYAKAREADREIIADHKTDRLDVVLTFDPGRRARFGPTEVRGESRVDPDFVRYMADFEEGKNFSAADVRAAEDRLAALGVFRMVRVEEAPEILPDGSLPMSVEVQDARRRTIGFGATYSTFDGFGLEAYWMHRNLFGRAERLRFDASVQGLGEAKDPLDLDYSAGVTYTRPGSFDPDTNLVVGLLAQQRDYDTYRETSASARAGLVRSFGRRLTGETFASVSRARFEDDFGTRDFLTFAVSGKGTYDRRDDALDPTRGYMIAAELQPFYEQQYRNAGLRGTLEGRGYLGFGSESRFVLAARGKLGTYLGPSIDESPPDQLFFAGGGGSIRGYSYRSIGIDYTEPDGDTVVGGGRGLVEGSVEFRARFGERFGGVAFADAGVVTRDAVPSIDDDLRVGVGIGARYYTAIGPLRVDLAVPLDPGPDDSSFGFYIGIGQAF